MGPVLDDRSRPEPPGCRAQAFTDLSRWWGLFCRACPKATKAARPERDLPGDGAHTPGRSPQAVNVADAASEHIIELVGKVKARTTLKVVTLLRVVVYGLVVVVALVTASRPRHPGRRANLGCLPPVAPVGRRVWLGYVVLGGLLFLGGAALLGRHGTARR